MLKQSQISEICRQLGIKPNKKLGQNFMIDKGTVEKIISLAGFNSLSFDSSNFDSPNFDSSNFDSSNSDSPNFDSSSGVLEIGPGFGALTDYLIESSQSYIGIEYDKKIFAWLNERYKSESQPKTQQKSQQKSQQKGHQKSVNFFHLDAMKLPERLDAMKLSDGGKNYEFDSKFNFNYLVANLPYNIAIPLLISYFRYFPQLKKAIVLVQKEAADRILAKKNEANYSIPSVKLDLLTHRKKLLAVPPSVFWPRPTVQSALIELTRRDDFGNLESPLLENPQPLLESPQIDKVFKLIDAGFSHRRKTLISSLEKSFLNKTLNTSKNFFSKAALSAKLASAKIPIKSRAQELDWRDFVKLAEIL